MHLLVTYIVVCLLFCLTIAVRYGFTRTYTLSTEISPNRKQIASVIVHDEGALGGSIEVRYEKLYGERSFFRCSKSVVVNLMKIEFMKPALNGRFMATLNNNEKVIISRQYVTELKKKLKGGLI